jgi:hypothetical protein
LDTDLGIFRKGNVAEYEGMTYVNAEVKHISDALHDELSSSPISQNELLALIRLEHENETADDSDISAVAMENLDTEIYDAEKLQSEVAIIKGLRKDAPEANFIVKTARSGQIRLGLEEWQLLRQDKEARLLLIDADKQEELSGEALLAQKGRFHLEIDFASLDENALSQIEALLSLAQDAKMVIHKS